MRGLFEIMSMEFRNSCEQRKIETEGQMIVRVDSVRAFLGGLLLCFIILLFILFWLHTFPSNESSPAFLSFSFFLFLFLFVLLLQLFRSFILVVVLVYIRIISLSRLWQTWSSDVVRSHGIIHLVVLRMR